MCGSIIIMDDSFALPSPRLCHGYRKVTRRSHKATATSHKARPCVAGELAPILWSGTPVRAGWTLAATIAGVDPKASDPVVLLFPKGAFHKSCIIKMLRS
jgi:hypothetical protein